MKSDFNGTLGFLTQRHLFVDNGESIKSAGVGSQTIFNNRRNRIGYDEGGIYRGCLILDCNLVYFEDRARIAISSDRLCDG
jgi:hypothetical protein